MSRTHGQAAKGARSTARIAAVQALYQMDLAGTALEAVIEEFIAYRFRRPNPAAATADDTADQESAAAEDDTFGPDTEVDDTFFAEIVRGVVRRQRDIDPLIDRQLALGWRLVRVDAILRAILRAATFELFERSDVPARVVINEYIDVAHAFFEVEEPRVVNGVLDKMARQLRPQELAAKDQG
jgi:N utilization substance protein B